MTEEQFAKASRLKQEASNIQGLIDFTNSSNVRCCVGEEDSDDPEVVVPVENIYTLNSDVLSGYYGACLETKEKLLRFLRDKLEELEREFDYV